MVLQVLKNFAGKTSIHGLGFVVDYRLSVFTRVTWALIFTAAIIWASIQLQFSVTCKLRVKFLGKTLSCKSFLLASTGQSIQTKPNFFPIWPLASADPLFPSVSVMLCSPFFQFSKQKDFNL
jgi:hypothetical protein